MNPTEQTTEFQRRRDLPGVEVRYMTTKRSSDVVLSLMGREIAAKHETLTRGKVVSTMYILPQMEAP